MSLFVVLLLSASALAYVPSVPSNLLEDAEQLFEEFIETYGKQYADETEKQMRLEVFKQFLQEVNERNADPEETATFGITQFADLTKAEFKRYLGYIPSPIKNTVNVSNEEALNGNAPDSWNWVTQGAVTPIKNQGGCGSCWAFSTTGAVEGSHFLKHKKLLEVSEQQLVDCDKTNSGCNGGDMAVAAEYLIAVGGIESEKSYPYEGIDDKCKYDRSKDVAKPISTKKFNGTEDQLKQFLYVNGPLSIAVDASSWGPIKKGILKNCGKDLDHGVLLVGYGTDNGVPYWLVKNEWGTHWGDQGYIRLFRGANTCGMMNEPPLKIVVA